ncbi:MAG: Maf-like protein [Dysgonamonadaceae bacterium]|jgi:septum formation protein|nr:Maf-like protein [Dysgonamonadaceae bacterium]
MLENIKKYRLILASNSPRRKELLSGLDVKYEVRKPPEVKECYPETLQREEIPVYLARLKASACSAWMQDDTLLLTADTIVWFNGKVYGKPKNETDSIATLKALSGNTHEVITGVCLTSNKKQTAFHSVSKVKFAELDEPEINYYVKHYTPRDKAGAYGVQEWIGYIGVEYLEGSFYNVMGLPASRLYQELKNF